MARRYYVWFIRRLKTFQVRRPNLTVIPTYKNAVLIPGISSVTKSNMEGSLLTFLDIQ